MISRNSVRALAILFFLPFLTHCNKESARSAENSGTPREKPKEVDESQQVVLLNWHDYLAPEIAEQFKVETGITLVEQYYESLEESKSLLRTYPERYDVIVADDMSIAELIELKLIQPLDKDRLTSLTNIEKRYLSQNFDPYNRYSIPYSSGSTLIAYRKDQVTTAPTSWQALWDPAYKGKVGMLEEREELYSLTLLSIGKSMNSDEENDLGQCTSLLIDQYDKMDPVYASWEGLKQHLKDGSLALSVAYSSDVPFMASEDENIAYFIPEEGAPIWIDSFLISREAPNYEAAHKFINFMTRADIAAINANYLEFGTPNRAAKKELNPELLADVSLYPPQEVLAKCEFNKKPSSKRLRYTHDGMARLREHIRKESGGTKTVGVADPDAE